MVRFGFALVVAVTVAGCGGGGTGAPPLAATQQVVRSSAFGGAAGRPETCDASVHVLIHRQNGAFRIPRCDNWSGIIRYPGGGKKSRWVVTSSVTDNFGAPSPPSGTAIFYMQMWLRVPREGWPFPNGGVSDTIASPALTSDHTYTLNVYNFAYNEQCPSSQCTWTMEIGSPQSGSHSITFRSPLNGATVLPGNLDGPVWQFVQN